MWSPGELNQGLSVIPTPPPQTGLLPVNVDNNLMVGEVITSSSSSKLPVKRPYHNLEMEPVDFNIDQLLDATELIIKKYFEDPKHQEFPAHGTVVDVPGLRKGKKSKKEIDKNHRDRKKLKMQKLTEDIEELKTHCAKLGVFMKNYRKIKEQAILRLFNMIEGDVRCNLKKEELLAQFCSPNVKQTFDIYWEENLKYKNELQTIVEMFVYLRQVVPPMAAPPVQEGLPSVNVDPFPSYLDGLDGIDDDFLQGYGPFDDEILFSEVPILEPDPRQVVLPESSTRKHKKSRKETDKKYRDKQKVEMQKLMKDFEVMQTDIAKVEGFLKNYKNIREQAIARLNIMIEEDVRCKLNKEELWAQFCSPNGKQTFDIYWEENMKYRIEVRNIVIMFLNHPL